MRARMIASVMMLTAVGMAGSYISAAYPHDGMEDGGGSAHHHTMHATRKTMRTMAEYAIPPITLVRDDGTTVSLSAELNDGRPVVLNFIYTTCTEVCPLVSRTLAQLQDKLGADRDRVHLMSITIDPEADTPARLAVYARKYGAGPEWQHYSGTIEASIAAQRAFDAYRGDKMNHTPATFLRAAPGQPWIRIDGFATADELLGELRAMLAAG